MIDSTLLEILQCPACGKDGLDLELIEGQSVRRGFLHCTSCGTKYEVENDVPKLIPQERMQTDRWRLWQAHLDTYLARDQNRQKRPSEAREKRYRARMKAFADFMGVEGENVLLDIGCGSGKFRMWHDPERTTYIGIDPLPYPEAEGFSFAQAIAEFLPFRDNTFNSVVVRSALDHFCDLDAFLQETIRVLTPGGRFYLEQVVHEVRSPLSAMKTAIHAVKDWVDHLQTRASSDVPKHMNEFTRRTVKESLAAAFDLERAQEFNTNIYTPTQLFMAFEPKLSAEVTESCSPDVSAGA